MTEQELNKMLSNARIKRYQEYTIKDNIKRIEMADGESLSVQASSSHYCEPREDIAYWTHVEVGYPSVSPPETWSEYFDGDWDNSDGTDSVYGYVPIDLVIDFINEHGGLANK